MDLQLTSAGGNISYINLGEMTDANFRGVLISVTLSKRSILEFSEFAFFLLTNRIAKVSNKKKLGKGIELLKTNITITLFLFHQDQFMLFIQSIEVVQFLNQSLV